MKIIKITIAIANSKYNIFLFEAKPIKGIGPRKIPPAVFMFCFSVVKDEIKIKRIPRKIKIMPNGSKYFIIYFRSKMYLKLTKSYINFIMLISFKMRGKVVLCLLVLVLMPVVLAKTMEVELKQGESYFYDGRNITLLNLDKKAETVVICLNNKKEIISDYKNINGVGVDLKWVKSDKAKFEFRFSKCEDCDFGDWGNLDCFDECNKDEDCDDNDEETIDNCEGKPRRCVNEVMVKKEEKEENKTLEENKTIENKSLEGITSASVKEQKREFKSFTQWLFEAILNLFRNQLIGE